MLNVLDELEALRPEFKRLVEEFNKGYAGPQLVEPDSQERTGYTSERASMNWPSTVGSSFSGTDKWVWTRRSQCYLNIIICVRLKIATVLLNNYCSFYIYFSNLFVPACHLSVVCLIIYFPVMCIFIRF